MINSNQMYKLKLVWFLIIYGFQIANGIFLLLFEKRWITFSTSMYMSLWIFNNASPVKRVSHIVDFNHVLRCRNEENVLSELELLIGKLINNFNILFIKGKTSSSQFCNISIACLEITDESLWYSRIHFSFQLQYSPTNWEDISFLT